MKIPSSALPLVALTTALTITGCGSAPDTSDVANAPSGLALEARANADAPRADVNAHGKAVTTPVDPDRAAHDLVDVRALEAATLEDATTPEDPVKKRLEALKGFSDTASGVFSWFFKINGLTSVAQVIPFLFGELGLSLPADGKSPEQQMLDKLNQIIDMLAVQTRQVNTEFRANQDRMISDHLVPIRVQAEAARVDYARTLRPWPISPFELATNHGHVMNLVAPGYCDRANIPEATEFMGSDWKRAVTQQAVAPGARTWEYRACLPAFMAAIDYRIILLGATNPNYTSDALVKQQFAEYENVLDSFVAKIEDGIRCGSVFAPITKPKGGAMTGNYTFYCADTWTGTFVRAGVASARQGSLTFETYYEPLRADLRTKLGVFEVRKLANALRAVRTRGNASVVAGTLATDVASGMCLGTRGGASLAGTPAALTACPVVAASNTLRWTYDSVTGQLRHEASGLCLEVPDETLRWMATAAPRTATPTTIQPCFAPSSADIDRQRWTIDLVSGRVSSAKGRVLDVQWGSGSAGTPVWTWEANGGTAQRWRLRPTLFPVTPTRPFGL